MVACLRFHYPANLPPGREQPVPAGGWERPRADTATLGEQKFIVPAEIESLLGPVA
jgi:hypothetical protein